MTTTYTFITDDEREARLALNAGKMLSILYNLDNSMRADVKYHEGKQTTEHWREILNDLCHEEGIDLYD